ncbi:ankyrin repeat-containing domain protein [Aspergillus aurantiobrunneus]
MADPLSIAASIAGLVSLAGSVFGALCQLTLQLKDYKREINQLQSETRALSVLLHDLSLLATALETEPAFNSSFRLEHVDACERTLHEIKTTIESIQPAQAAGSGSAKIVKSTISRLKWPYSSKEFQKHLGDLSHHKETISIALSADSMKALLRMLSKQSSISDGIDDIRETVREIKTRIFIDEHRQKVLDFFTPVNPQIHLETSLRLRHPLTGLWLTEGLKFTTWISEQNAKLWMSGIPGGGKTIMAGSVIEEVLQKASHTNAMGVCFFFCDYKDPKSLDLANIFSSFASQLARQNDQAYTILESYYADLHPDRSLPRPVQTSQILCSITKMINLFHQVMIVVDGLDECGFDSTVPVALADLARGSPAVSMVLLSRDEFDIREALEPDFAHVDIAAQGSDVRRYVREELEGRIKQRRLRLRSPALKEDIINTLIEKAGGMFRWVSCQLDYLCELPMDKDRREALAKLPPTLNATYERILLRYNHPSATHIICTSLRLVAAIGPSITIPALCEAVSVPNDAARLTADDPVLEEDIIRYCSSLLRKSPDKQHFEFAHFTVQEFLESVERLGTPLDKYYIGADNIAMIIELCIRFLLLDDFQLIYSATTPEQVGKFAHGVCEQHPFYKVAACEWPFLNPKFLRDVGAQGKSAAGNEAGDPFLGALASVSVLFGREAQYHFRLWAVVFCEQFQEQFHPRYDEGVAAGIAAIIDGTFSALHMACALTLPVLITEVVERCPESLLLEKPIPPAACLVIGLPVLLFEEGLSFEGGCRVSTHSVQIWDHNRVPVEIWTDAMATVAQHGIGLPQIVEMGGTQESSLRFVLWRHESDFRSRPDPTQGMLKLLRAGFLVDSGAILQLESATAVFCSRGNPNRDELKDRLEMIARELELRDEDEVDTEELAETLGRIVDNLSPGPGVPDIQQIEVLTDFAFTSNVYNAVLSNNIPVLELYFTDKRFKRMARGIYPNAPLLHLALESACYESFQYLLTVGCSDSVANLEGSTVWHLLAESGSLRFLKALKSLSEDPVSRQEDKNYEGYTPIRLAVQIQQYHIARELLPLCRSSNCFTGRPSVYELTFQGGVGSVELMGSLASAKIPPEGDRLPIHETPVNADLATLKQWTSIWPESRDKRYKGQLPLEILLEKLPSNDSDTLEKEVLIELLPTVSPLKLEVYHFFCSNVVASSVAKPTTSPHFPKLLGVVLEVLADIHNLPLLPLIEAFHSYIEATDAGRDGEAGWPEMAELDAVVYRIITSNINCIESTYRSELLQSLLYIAAFLDWKIVCDACFALGSSVHDALEVRLTLEVACHPESLCSEATFSGLLSSGDIIQPYYLTPMTFLLVGGKDLEIKLTLLLEHGADANARHPESGEPAVIYHLLHGSADAANVLLKHGADPLSQLECGFDVVCGFIWHDMVDELEAFRQKHPQFAWSSSFCFPSQLAPEHKFSRYVGNMDIPGFTLLHLAAFRGSFRCVRYLIEEDLVPNVNVATAGEWTCVHFMAACDTPNFEKAMGYLQGHGCDINALGVCLETALDIATACAVPLRTIKALLHMGAKWSKTSCFRVANVYWACTALEYACAVLLEELSPGESLTTAMLYVLANAVKHGDISIIKRLLALGCPLDESFPDCGQCSPLLHASYYEQWTVVEWLLDYDRGVWGTGCKVIAFGDNPISLAAKDSQLIPILERLLDHFWTMWPQWLLQEVSPIIDAISAKNIGGLQIILKFIANKASEKEVIGSFPSLASILNAPRTYMALHEATRQGDKTSIQMLIDHDAAIDARDVNGNTALYYAVKAGEYAALEFLLDHGATITTPSFGYPSLLHLAAKHNDVDLLKLIYPYCTSAIAPSLPVSYLSPLSFCQSKRCVQYLLDQGLSFGSADAVGISPLHRLLGIKELQPFILQSNFLNSHGLDHDQVNFQDLEYDLARGIVESIPILLRVLGKASTLAMFPARPARGFSALCIAAESACVDSCRALVSIGADLDYDAHPYGAPLAVAISYGNLETVKFLVRAGAGLVYFDRKEARCKGVFYSAYGKPEILSWLLVGRWTEQRKITFSE